MTHAWAVYRSPRPWEDDHTHLDSLWMTEAEALRRAAQFDVPVRTRFTPSAWVGKIDIGVPLDKSVLEDA